MGDRIDALLEEGVNHLAVAAPNGVEVGNDKLVLLEGRAEGFSPVADVRFRISKLILYSSKVVAKRHTPHAGAASKQTRTPGAGVVVQRRPTTKSVIQNVLCDFVNGHFANW